MSTYRFPSLGPATQFETAYLNGRAFLSLVRRRVYAWQDPAGTPVWRAYRINGPDSAPPVATGETIAEFRAACMRIMLQHLIEEARQDAA